jgi:hypothetical protein
MTRIIHPTTLALTLLAGLTLLSSPACVEDERPDETLREAELSVQTIILDLTLPADVEHEAIETIAHSAEALAGSELVGARISAKQIDDGHMTVSLVLWGLELEAADAIVAQLRAAHPELVDTPITIAQHEGAPADEPLAGDHDDETPDQTEARVTKELRDQGVEGEITVDVADDANGRRRVEVHVEAPS